METRVYLIASRGLYKIGLSYRVQRRLREVAPDDPDARVVHSFVSNYARRVESAIHQRYADKHVGKEWFSLDPEEVAEFCSLAGPIDEVADLPEQFQPPTATNVRLDRELLRLARILCAFRGEKVGGYLDSLVRERIVADYEAFMAFPDA